MAKGDMFDVCQRQANKIQKLEEQFGMVMNNVRTKLGEPAVKMAMRGTRLEYRHGGISGRTFANVRLLPRKKNDRS